MSLTTIRYRNGHRPAPMRGGFVWQSKKAISRSVQRANAGSIRTDLRHLSKIAISQTCSVHTSGYRTTTQIPIDHRPT